MTQLGDAAISKRTTFTHCVFACRLLSLQLSNIGSTFSSVEDRVSVFSARVPGLVNFFFYLLGSTAIAQAIAAHLSSAVLVPLNTFCNCRAAMISFTCIRSITNMRWYSVALNICLLRILTPYAYAPSGAVSPIVWLFINQSGHIRYQMKAEYLSY